MGSNSEQVRSGLAKQLVGVAMVIVAVVRLAFVDDPFPLWLIIAGGGVMFVGVGASIRRQRD